MLHQAIKLCIRISDSRDNLEFTATVNIKCGSFIAKITPNSNLTAGCLCVDNEGYIITPPSSHRIIKVKLIVVPMKAKKGGTVYT